MPSMIGSITSPKEAMFYKKDRRTTVQCLLCPRECVVPDGKRGFCRNRKNQGETLYTFVHGRLAVVDIDPIQMISGTPILQLNYVKHPLHVCPLYRCLKNGLTQDGNMVFVNVNKSD
jgi:hypothetical protein